MTDVLAAACELPPGERPPSPSREREGCDAQTMCVACGRYHGSVTTAFRCLEAEVVRLRAQGAR